MAQLLKGWGVGEGENIEETPYSTPCPLADRTMETKSAGGG